MRKNRGCCCEKAKTLVVASPLRPHFLSLLMSSLQLKHTLFKVMLIFFGIQKVKVKNLCLWEPLYADEEILGVECDLARAFRCNVTFFGVASARMSYSKLKYRLVKIGNMNRIA